MERTLTHTHTHTHIYTHLHVHARTRTHTHALTHPPKNSFPKLFQSPLSPLLVPLACSRPWVRSGSGSYRWSCHSYKVEWTINVMHRLLQSGGAPSPSKWSGQSYMHRLLQSGVDNHTCTVSYKVEWTIIRALSPTKWSGQST